MLRLDARGETKLRQPRDIALLKHLGVLDGTMGMSTLCAVEYDGVRLIPDGMAGDVEAMLGGQSHVGFDLFRRITQGSECFRSDA